MPYLFADSEPFPLAYDFLSTLRALVHSAAQTYAQLARVDELRRTIAEREQRTHAILSALGEFGDAMEAARSAASEHFTEVPEVVLFSQQLEAYLDEKGSEARALCARTNDEKNRADAAEIDRCRQAMRQVVDAFVLDTQIGMELTYGHLTLRDDETYDVRIGAWTPGPIEVEYGVAIDRLPEWKEPRRVESIAGPLILQIGMKKKLFRKDLTRELIDVSDYTLGEARVHAGGAEVQLRRKPNTTKDAVLLRIQRADGQLAVSVSRLEQDAAPFSAPDDDLPRFERLWQSLQQVASAALPQRSAVHGVRLDGQDVFAHDLAPRLFDRLIERFAPFVHDIARRSPSAHELSLKLERDDGRREELYLKKSELLDELRALDEGMRARFGPLGSRRALGERSRPTEVDPAPRGAFHPAIS